MKSLLKAIAFVLAAGVPSALFAQLGGADIPAPASVGYLFIGFVAALTLLTAVNDYAYRPRRVMLPQSAGPASAEIVALRAAPTEERRLAA